jgi:hypothetical protein
MRSLDLGHSLATLNPLLRLLCEGLDDFCGDVKEEDGSNEREGKYEDNEGVTAHFSLALISAYEWD